MAAEYIRVAHLQELSDRRGKLVRIGEKEIALFYVEGTVYALDNVCAHQHFSALHQGEVNGTHVSCPMHGWTYAMDTGKAVSGSGRVKVYPVQVKGNEVFVGVETLE
ncbi:MAG TPA: Rieske 2Fe-2S domain-containing protein [Bacteroidota bacterium]|nr:Rieske 2Fe-2S domain-containing protein [Bacteroidota bacterium]